MLHPQSLIGSILETRLLRWIGRLSYSLYLWQQLFLGSGMKMWPWKLAACLVAATASYYLVERPALRLGHRFAPPTTAGRADIPRFASAERTQDLALS
jgi:peptidoglycan/LPS O-acetylase OafA/YrhL